jgi:hypothetical protein
MSDVYKETGTLLDSLRVVPGHLELKFLKKRDLMKEFVYFRKHHFCIPRNNVEQLIIDKKSNR